MSAPQSDSPSSWESPFDSRDTVIFTDDGPGDTTVRPARPLLLKLGLAERERLARYQDLMDKEPPAGPSGESSADIIP